MLGFSGGPDSLTLLDILMRGGFSVIAAHYNHHLRLESDQDVCRAGELAASLGAEFVSGGGDVRGFAETHGLSLEDAGRQLRYTFLFQEARKAGAAAVVVGHNADDQVETLLMNLLRGAGLSGLKGMPWRALPTAWDGEIPLVRPLLSTWREEVEAYCRARSLHPLVDATNQDVAYERNRVRLELIPALERHNPEVKKALWRASESLQGDDELVRAAVEEAWQRVCLDAGQAYLALNRPAFLRESLGVQRRLARRAAAALLKDAREFDFEAVEHFLDFAAHPGRSRHTDLAAGLCLQVEEDRLWLACWDAALPVGDWPQVSEKPLPLPVPGQLDLGQGWFLTTELDSLTPQSHEAAIRNADLWQAWLDTVEPLSVRRRRRGDRIRPLGMGGQSIKVSDLMINCKLPVRARQAWPLVCAGEEIAWVPGLRLSQDHCLKPGSSRVVHLSFEKGFTEEETAD